MILFCALLLAHLLYDFHWQGEFIAQGKGKYPFLLFVHVLTWTLLLSAVLYGMHALQPWHLPFLFITHIASDRWKSRLPKTANWFWAIYVDQAIHLLSIVAVAIK